MTYTKSGPVAKFGADPHIFRKRQPVTAKTYTFRQLVDFLCVVGQVAPESKSTFVSRIMQLQRLGFPDGVNVGHGVRMKYSIVEIYKLALAFEILATGLPPRVTLSAIRENWDLIDGCIETFFDQATSDNFKSPSEIVILMMPGCSDFTVCSGLVLQIVDFSGLFDVLSNSSEISGRSGLVVVRLHNLLRRIEKYSDNHLSI